MIDAPFSRRSLLGAGAALPLLSTFPRVASAFPQLGLRVAAPFAMPTITVPDFRSSRRFPITDYGAVPDDKAATGRAIAKAITAANAAGSGVVVVPPGIWLTGKIHLKSNVDLHVAKGATLLFSEDPADYLPPVPTSWEGLECYNYSPLVYAYDCQNVAISGEGTLKPKLDVWTVWSARPKAHMDALVKLYMYAVRGVPIEQRQMVYGEAHLRPQMIQFNRCRNVVIEDIRIEGSPFWTIHPYRCRDVVIRRVKVHARGHNNDGVDPEMSQNVLIEDCVFDQGDDAIAVKSGREFDAWAIRMPSRNIVMRNCRVENGHQLMAIGSELSGGVENVFVDECHFARGAVAAPVPINNLLYIKTNERRGGFVRNIHMSNVTASQLAGGVLSVETDVLYQWRDLVPTYERRLTPIEGLHVSNIHVAQAKFVCNIAGDAAMPVRHVTMRGVKVDTVLGTRVTTVNAADVSIVDA